MRQLDRLFRVYQEGGQVPAARQELVEALRDYDLQFPEDSNYLIAKARYLSLLGETLAAVSALEKVPDEFLTEPIDVVNRLRRLWASDPGRVVFLGRRLACSDDPRARERFVAWIHESVVQTYAPIPRIRAHARDQDAALAILGEPACPLASTATSGLRALVAAQQVAQDPQALATLATNAFGGEGARSERYRLLVARVLARHAELRQSADAMREGVISHLRGVLEGASPKDPSCASDSERAACRYVLAHAYFERARECSERQESACALESLRLAAEWSANERDLQDGKNLFEATVVALGGPREFRWAYAEALRESGRVEEALTVMTQVARLYPDRAQDLERQFRQVRPSESFEQFWASARLAGRAQAPDVTVTTAAGDPVRIRAFLGGWVLVDFWGTWCGPCVEQMPAVERLHRETLAASRGRVLTVAVDDSPGAVAGFMAARGLTFPVFFADEAGVAPFEIPYFPHKVLIAPDGRFFPLGKEDWEREARRLLLGR